MSGPLQAGVGRADITPPVGIAHAGWGAQLHERAEGVDQPFVVTALALADDETTCLIVEMDTGLLMIDDADAIRDAVAEAVGLTRSLVRLSYSHTHAGPILHAVNIKAGFELVEPYWMTLRSQTIGAAREAIAALRPARVGAALTTCSIAVNRRFETPDGRVVCSPDVDGFTDPTVTVARIDGEDGSAIAAIVGYACHPITLAFQNRLLSPDYPGVTRSTLEQLTGATCLFLQGAAGDQMPIEALTGDLSVHRRLGTRLGAAASEAYLGIDPFERSWTFDRVVESGAPLGMRKSQVAPPGEDQLRVATHMVEMPLRERLDLATTEARRDAIADELAAMRDTDTDPEVLRDAMFRMKRSEMRVWFASMYGGQDSVAIELQGMRVGPLSLVGFPGEPFAATGAAVRERSPLPTTLLSGYTNGWAGYVPTAVEFPRLGYEVEFGSHFAAGAAETLEDAAVALLEQLA
jgi:Neutral/alkaline non-lysosomal ceramidase, N-terminal